MDEEVVETHLAPPKLCGLVGLHNWEAVTSDALGTLSACSWQLSPPCHREARAAAGERGPDTLLSWRLVSFRVPLAKV